MLTASEIAIANECIKMLQLFEEITSEISTEKNVTSNKIIAMVYLLYDTIKSNPIEYWITYKVTSKYLSRIALEYLSVVGISVPSERMFSRTENIMITDNRNRLKGDQLSRLLFLLDISDWHLEKLTK
ncbi:hypothetical protein ALC56_02390 [Trachymyrmex septentrionalis]|uniref:HAT C-terminal dimerisation domain-containing protein n=1 Tax=Trachymyrmex septentrionalis TaxID=34720 RepID=A0A195FRZ9_9HYME|nr:hypothetical protein ALC56_02390 [Trachymyrmex septentrionalis]